MTCGWCSRTIPSTPPVSSASGSFCSELCFSQLRRATFKRNKTCDWCRHVRHTVSHADILESGRRLQFCSDRCLNQYKMHVFCRETRAHLDLHPHVGTVPGGAGEDQVLITPDLWLKDCGETERGAALGDGQARERGERRRSQVRKLKGNCRRGSNRCSTVTSADEVPVQVKPLVFMFN